MKIKIIGLIIVLVIAAGSWWYVSKPSALMSPEATTATTTDNAEAPKALHSQASKIDPLVAVGSSGFKANHSSFYIPTYFVPGDPGVTITSDTSGNKLTFLNPAHLKVFGSPKMGDIYVASSNNVYMVKWAPDSPTAVFQLIPEVDGATLTLAGDEEQVFYRDTSGVYCWANLPGGGGGLQPRYRILSVPLTDSIDIQNVHSDNLANKGQTSNFTWATINDTTKNIYYKLIGSSPTECEDVRLVPISVEEHAQLYS